MKKDTKEREAARTPQAYNDTIVHDFSYKPTDVTKQKSFDQSEEKSII
jgi:hypothetical protein